MPIYCPRCGTQNSDWAQTCQQCSTTLPLRAQSPNPQQQPAPPPSYPPSPGYPQSSPGYPQPAPYGGGGYGSAAGYGAVAAPYASIGKRFVAYLLDALMGCVAALPGIAVIVIGAIIAGAGAGARGEPEGAGVAVMMLGYGLTFLCALAMGIYNIYLLGRDGATLGKRWMGIKVLDQTNQPLGFGKAFLRELVKGLVGNVCALLLLWPLWDNEKQGLYDKLFSTHVYEA